MASDSGRRVEARSEGGRELVRYASGERRVEDRALGLCTDWLYYSDAELAIARPDSMDDWNLDETLEGGE